jgi:hypothetical protein
VGKDLSKRENHGEIPPCIILARKFLTGKNSVV